MYTSLGENKNRFSHGCWWSVSSLNIIWQNYGYKFSEFSIEFHLYKASDYLDGYFINFTDRIQLIEEIKFLIAIKIQCNGKSLGMILLLNTWMQL